MKSKPAGKDSLPTSPPLLEEEDVFSGLGQIKGTSLLLGKYSLSEVGAVLGKRNFFREARKRHLWPLEYSMDSSQYPLQRFQIFLKEKKTDNLIVDLKLKEGLLHLKNPRLLGLSSRDFKVLSFDWLTLQNPLLTFSKGKTPLPGQLYPGLGLGKKVMDLFRYLAKLMGKDGLVAQPAYFHNAVLFSRFFRFSNPEKRGEVLAIRKSFPDVPLKKLAWVIHRNCLRDKDGKTYEWKAEEQVCPLSRPLRRYFNSRWYRTRVKQSQKKNRFTIDWDCYRRKEEEAESPAP